MLKHFIKDAAHCNGSTHVIIYRINMSVGFWNRGKNAGGERIRKNFCFNNYTEQ